MTQTPEPVDTFQMLRANPNDPPNIRLLRLAVIGMGLILVLGVATVIGRITYLAMRQRVPVVTTSGSGAGSGAGASEPALGSSGAISAELRLALPPGAKVRSQSLAGNRLAVHYEGAGGEGIIILDLETGRPVSQVRIEAGAK